MQNLRDKLLKVGLVDKRRKQAAETEARRERKQKTAAEQAHEEELRQQEYAARLAAEAEAQRRLEAERAEERAQHERRHRVRSIADRWSIRQHKPGPQRFYFAQRSGKIGRFQISAETAEGLSQGALAIVERQADPGGTLALSETHVLVPWEAAERVLAIEPQAVRFWARSSQPIGITEDQK